MFGCNQTIYITSSCLQVAGTLHFFTYPPVARFLFEPDFLALQDPVAPATTITPLAVLRREIDNRIT